MDGLGRLLDVRNMDVCFRTHEGESHVIRDASFCVNHGEVMAIVGESGSGKSVLTQACLKLIPMPPGEIRGGKALYNGRDLLQMNENELRAVRGKEVAVVFQDAMTALNPTMRIGAQLVETIIEHEKISKRDAKARAAELLRMVKIPNPEKYMRQYIFQCSGGMRQRVMIAIAIACRPKLIIADEPTTALDVTIKTEILNLLVSLLRELGTSVLLITHDLGMVASYADRIGVMYAGRFVETGTSHDIFYRAKHPYTRGLLRAAPRLDLPPDQDLATIPGAPPNPALPRRGCAFAVRCANCMEVCKAYEPPLTDIDKEHTTRCWLLDPRAENIRNSEEAGA